MGDTNYNCAVTGVTIEQGQEFYMQFLLPQQYAQYNDKKTPTVTNHGSCADWVPIGPAIKCEHGYTEFEYDSSEENKKRIAFLEELFDMDFPTLLRLATTTAKGVDVSLMPVRFKLQNDVAVTFIHAVVYDTLADKSFYASNQTMYEAKDKYRIPDKFNEVMESLDIKTGNTELDDVIINMKLSNCFPFALLAPVYGRFYAEKLHKTKHVLDWLAETHSVMWSLSSMGIPFRMTNAVGDRNNYDGWKRINEALKETLTT